jgi:hypothetical protein
MAGAFVVNAARQVAGSKRFLSRRTASRVSKTNVAARAEAKEIASADKTTFFAGDIGGTNARLQVWQVDASGASTLKFEKTYSTSDHPTFESCVADLYKDSEVDKGERLRGVLRRRRPGGGRPVRDDQHRVGGGRP